MAMFGVYGHVDIPVVEVYWGPSDINLVMINIARFQNFILVLTKILMLGSKTVKKNVSHFTRNILKYFAINSLSD